MLPGVADREDLVAVVGGDAGVQPGEAAVAVLVEQRQQPVLDGEAGAGRAVGRPSVAQRAPGALEVVPVPFGGVLDGADADDVVVGGRGRGDVLAVGDADEHVGGEQRRRRCGSDGEDLGAWRWRASALAPGPLSGGVGQVDVDAEDVGVARRGDGQAADRLVDGAADPAVRLAELGGELLRRARLTSGRDRVEAVEDRG